MYRYEAKHKVLTTLASKTNNFINICKTLAERHQDSMEAPIDVYSDKVRVPKHRTPVNQSDRHANQLIQANLNTEVLEYIKFVVVNGIEYRKGLMLMFQPQWGEILSVLTDGNDFYLLYHPFILVDYDSFCNSIIVSKNKECTPRLIMLSDLPNKKTYQKVVSKNLIHIIAEDLKFNCFIE